jgi:hypothetical protein
MNALERLDDITVHLDSAVDSIKELPERFEPLGFHVGQGGSRDVSEKGHTGAGCILDPCHSNAEKLTPLFGATPVSDLFLAWCANAGRMHLLAGRGHTK